MRKNKTEILAYQAKLSRVEPWSLGKMIFSVGTVLAVIFLGAVGLAWLAIDMIGVWAKINSTIASVVGDDTAFSIQKYLSLKNSLIITGLFSIVNLLVATFVAIVAAYLFNAFSALLGGVRVELWNSPVTAAEDILKDEVKAQDVESPTAFEGRRVARYRDETE